MDQEEQKNQLPEEAAQEQKQPKGYEAYLSLYDLVRLLAVITLIFVFFFRLVGVDGSSMYPTLSTGIIWCWKAISCTAM